MRDPRNLYLIVQFALKDFKIRYSHTVLGYVWSVLSPLIFTLTYYVVFSIFIRFEVINYPGYLLLGIVLWNFFSEGTSHGATALLARSGIVTKIPMNTTANRAFGQPQTRLVRLAVTVPLTAGPPSTSPSLATTSAA